MPTKYIGVGRHADLVNQPVSASLKLKLKLSGSSVESVRGAESSSSVVDFFRHGGGVRTYLPFASHRSIASIGGEHFAPNTPQNRSDFIGSERTAQRTVPATIKHPLN
jgi:hypothetical protein